MLLFQHDAQVLSGLLSKLILLVTANLVIDP